MLAGTLYASPVFRPFTDIDLVVKDGDETAVATVLGELGYAEHSFRRKTGGAPTATTFTQGAPFHRTFMGSRQRLVELHADPLQLGLRPACEAARWARAVPIPQVPGASMLGPEDQLVQLSVHLHKHGFSRLIWLKDLDLLLRGSPTGSTGTSSSRWPAPKAWRPRCWHGLRLASTRAPHAGAGRRAAPLPTAALVADAGWLWCGPRRDRLDCTAPCGGERSAFDAAESWRGMLPALVLMGRRRDRARALASALRAWRP